MNILPRRALLESGFWLGLFLAFYHVAAAQGGSSYTVLPLSGVWKYNTSGLDLGTNWRETGYDYFACPVAPCVLGFEDNSALRMSLITTTLPLTSGSGAFITNF